LPDATASDGKTAAPVAGAPPEKTYAPEKTDVSGAGKTTEG
jgi:hypothetical protein